MINMKEVYLGFISQMRELKLSLEAPSSSFLILVVDLETAVPLSHQRTGGRADDTPVHTALKACRFLFGWDKFTVSGDCRP